MFKAIFGSMVGVVLAAVPAGLEAKPAPARPVERLVVEKVTLPGEGRGDFLLADPDSNHLFVTHGQLVHVLDLKTLKPLAEVTGLTVAHGVALDGRGRAYVTDGKSDTVVLFDSATGHELQRIAAGKEPDAILFDAHSTRIMSFNRGSEDVSVIDTKKMVLDHLIPLRGCDGPAPLAFDATNRRLFSGCGNKVMAVIDADTGKIVATVPIGGDPDGIVFDPTTKRIFVANRDGGWTIVRQASANAYRVEQTLKIDEYAKTVALDPKTHRVFSSTADLVWPPAVPGKKHLPNAKPGTFRLIVVSQL